MDTSLNLLFHAVSIRPRNPPYWVSAIDLLEILSSHLRAGRRPATLDGYVAGDRMDGHGE